MAAKSPLELYLIVVFVLFSGFCVLAAYASDDVGLTHLGRRFGLSARDVGPVAIVAILVPAGLWFAGATADPGALTELNRGEIRSLGLLFFANWGLFTAGLLGFVAAGNHLAAYRRLRRTDVTVGGESAVAGLVVGEPGLSPFRRTPAVCWTWRVDVQNRHGINNDQWTVTCLGSGGVPFRVETDDGAVHVDPTGDHTHLSLVGTSTCEVEAGERLADTVGHEVTHDAAREVEREYDDSGRRYVETVVTPGTAVTATGHCVDRDGERWLVGTSDTELVVSEGGRSATLSRYRTRVAAAALVGVAGTWLGGSYLVGVFGW